MPLVFQTFKIVKHISYTLFFLLDIFRSSPHFFQDFQCFFIDWSSPISLFVEIPLFAKVVCELAGFAPVVHRK
jgi:hypothetical protein